MADLDHEAVRLRDLLAIDCDEIGPWSIREMQDLTALLLASWERRGEALRWIAREYADMGAGIKASEALGIK